MDWTDGPTEKEVRNFLSTFNDDGRDDSMTDLWCGSQYTAASRHYSPESFYWAVGEVEREFGVKIKVTDEISKYTGARSLYIKRGDDIEIEAINAYPDRYAGSQVNRRLWETDFRKLNLPPAPPVHQVQVVATA